MSRTFPEAPYLICELANSHAGDVSVVRALIREFAGLRYAAKGIKFQVFAADTVALPDFPFYSVYQEIAFGEAAWHSLIEEASAHGDVWIDVFDRHATQVVGDNLERVCGLKLQASVLENEEVLTELRGLDLTSKQLILNVSGFDLDRIGHLVTAFRSMASALTLQIGYQSYPTKNEDTALQKIRILSAAFPECPIAMADHASGSSDFAQLVPVYAWLLGASVLEKHVCLDRGSAKYDGSSALEPNELQRLCDRLGELQRAVRGPFISSAERQYLAKTVQVPVVRTGVGVGTRVDTSDVLFRRTGQTGLTWPEVAALQRQGQRVTRAVAAGLTLLPGDFGPARVAAIVACRMKSSRLTRKAIVPIAGVPSVERCLYQCLGASGVSQVILATSTLEEDQVLEEYRCGGLAEFWTGDPEDVIARYVGACDHFGVDVIVRVTADCPLVSTEIMEHLLASHFESGADYTAAEDAAVGTACEIIEASALRTVIGRIGRAEHSEYMTWYLRNNADVFRLNVVPLPDELVRGYRLTLDYPEDLEVFEAVLSELGGEAKDFRLPDVFRILDSKPDIAKKNAFIEQKYLVDQSLINLLKEETRFPPNVEAGSSTGGGRANVE